MTRNLQKSVCFIMLLMLIQLIHAENRTRRAAYNEHGGRATGQMAGELGGQMGTALHNYFSAGLCCQQSNVNNGFRCDDGTYVGKLRGISHIMISVGILTNVITLKWHWLLLLKYFQKCLLKLLKCKWDALLFIITYSIASVC